MLTFALAILALVLVGAVVWLSVVMARTLHRVNDTEDSGQRGQIEMQALELAHSEISAQRVRIDQESQALERGRAELERDRSKLRAEERRVADLLSDIAGLTPDQARQQILKEAEDQAEALAHARRRQLLRTEQRRSEERARSILTTAAQRLISSGSAPPSTTIVPIASPEMKGRIIGSQGRNIHVFEELSGVNTTVDEGQLFVTLSSFDPERRETARIALESLIADGRINPSRIESALAAAQATASERDLHEGEDAAGRARVSGLSESLLRELGRLRLRLSYGQNVLEHLVEVASIAGSFAAEIGADEELARRAALLHDLGKGAPAEEGGSHAAIGAAMAAREGERRAVVDAIAAHHNEVEPTTVEAVIVQIADSVSASRPAARTGQNDHMLTRMRQIEELILREPGVAGVLALSAGRDIRVMVDPDRIDDAGTRDLADTLALRIHSALRFPGSVTVTVIRDLRATATTTATASEE